MKNSYTKNSLFTLQQIAETVTAIGYLSADLSNALNDDIAREQLPKFIDSPMIEHLCNSTRYLGELIALKLEDIRTSKLFGGVNE